MDVRYVITVDDTGATKKLQTFDQAIADLGKKSKTTGDSVRSFGSDFTRNLIPAFTAGQLAADGIKKSFALFKETIEDCIASASEAEKTDRSLESALAITGRTAEGTGEHFKRYAKELQHQTIYGDEAIKKTQTLLIQLTHLDRDGLDRATKGTIGLASVLGIDLASAATVVTKAMEGNYQTLQRYGIKVDENLSAGEKQAALMDKLIGFYKRAESDANTYFGGVSQLKEAYDELLESIGDFVVKNPEVVNALNSVKSIVEWLSVYIPKYAKLINQAADFVPGVMGLRSALILLAGAGKFAEADLKDLAAREKEGEKSARELWDAVVKNADSMKVFGVNLGPVIENLDGLLKKSKPLGDALGDQAKYVQTLADRYAELNDDLRIFRMLGSVNIVAPVSNAFGTLGDMVGGALGSVIDFKETVPGLFEGVGIGTTKAATDAENMASVWDSAMLSMTAGLVSFGDASASVWGNIGAIYANFIRSAISGIESLVIKEMWATAMTIKTKQKESVASHIANIFKSVPFPLDLVLAAGAFAVVNALFSKLLKFDKGGFADKPTLGVFGHGPEYILPERRLERLIERTVIKTEGGGGPGTVVQFGQNSIVINAQTLDDAAIQRARRGIFQAVEDELRLRGKKIH